MVRNRGRRTPPAHVLFFATARTAVGQPRIDRTVPADGIPANELLRELAHLHPALGPVLSSSRLFHNGVLLRRRSERVRPGDELAVHPPYGGG